MGQGMIVKEGCSLGWVGSKLIPVVTGSFDSSALNQTDDDDDNRDDEQDVNEPAQRVGGYESKQPGDDEN